MIEKTALEEAIKEKSPLNLSQIERLFGGEVNPANKAVVWRFLNMSHAQQVSIWQQYLRVEFQVEAVR